MKKHVGKETEKGCRLKHQLREAKVNACPICNILDKVIIGYLLHIGYMGYFYYLSY